MNDSVLAYQVTAGLAYLTLNRPHQANALSLSLLRSLQQALEDLKYRDEVRVVLLTGAGERAFCAGADLKERRGMDDSQVRQAVDLIRTVVESVARLPMPVIAAINGVAFGGGTELALAADLRIISATAELGLTETSLAIIPGAGGTQRLPRLIGPARAKELIYTARRIDAPTALQLGIVNRVVESAQVLPTAVLLAEEISKNGPIAVRQAKFAVDTGLSMDLASGLSVERAAYERVIPTADRQEALEAFAAKRVPHFQGH
ncbi:enoyl-CoA hydratase [Alicyclobacillaceae bacterium I2511]|nr:enoyl-CoA hydratase [Alicyclobacillaceae bacterium I2511]